MARIAPILFCLLAISVAISQETVTDSVTQSSAETTTATLINDEKTLAPDVRKTETESFTPSPAETTTASLMNDEKIPQNATGIGNEISPVGAAEVSTSTLVTETESVTQSPAETTTATLTNDEKIPPNATGIENATKEVSPVEVSPSTLAPDVRKTETESVTQSPAETTASLINDRQKDLMSQNLSDIDNSSTTVASIFEDANNTVEPASVLSISENAQNATTLAPEGLSTIHFPYIDDVGNKSESISNKIRRPLLENDSDRFHIPLNKNVINERDGSDVVTSTARVENIGEATSNAQSLAAIDHSGHGAHHATSDSVSTLYSLMAMAVSLILLCSW